ncbi:conserved hypothetical protein [Vibrio aestuarianus]|uniref:hypothetical protein n=1 Tax=Vibrio aestuarianus TaxID=28171 RepID=UPI0021C30375|nr:hypothetical protein [Vibrio aestuarianus]MDE1216580.1 hypothetical protein [Vibrio aestuarianus]CAH8236562.1 conserved hypothetical protein [Vibrio aestuarianus]
MSVKTTKNTTKDKVLIVERQFIHTHFNEYQRLLLPSDLSFKALKVAFYLLHHNQLTNHFNQTNEIAVCSASLSELCCYFQSSRKPMLAVLEALNHPLLEINSVDDFNVIYTVDTTAFRSRKVIKNDNPTNETKEACYFINLDEMKPHRSIIGWMMSNFKGYYGQQVKLNRTFLFDLFGYESETEKERKNAVRSIKRASKPQGYIYQNYCFVLAKPMKKQAVEDDYAVHLSLFYSEQEQEVDLRSISDYEAYYGQL